MVQQGIEIVRNIRDTNWINNRNWSTGFPPISPGGSLHQVALIDNDHGWKIIDGQQSNIQGIFTRSIEFPSITSDKITIQCDIKWSDASGPHTVTAIDYITNWQKK